MQYTSLRNKEICITVEKAQGSDKVVVWGCFYGKGGKNFQRYFETIEKAMEKYLAKCEMILNK